VERAPRRAVLLVNRKARRGREWYELAERELRANGIELAFSRAFKSIRELEGFTSEALEAKIPMIVAGGGDGTFSALSDAVLGKDVVVGVLPLGTGNAFARDLGIPTNVAEACRIIAEGHVRPVDIGRLDHTTFVNVATVGLTTEIAESLTPEAKRRFGRMVYAYAVLRALMRVKPFRVRIETENGTREFETLQVVIGNGRYHAGPFPLSPEASISEGKLSLYALQTTSKSAFIRLARHLPAGRQGQLPDVHAEETIGGRIIAWPSQPVTVDGEICARTESRFEVIPGALRVVAR